jgi:hypothetical protein
MICWKLLMDEMEKLPTKQNQRNRKTKSVLLNKQKTKKKKISYTFSYFVLSISLGRLLLCKLIDFLVIVLFLRFPFSVSHLSRWCILFLFLAFFAVSIYNIYMYRWCVGEGSSFLYMCALYLYSHKVRHDNSALFREQTAKAHQQGRIKRAKRRLCVRVYFVWRWPNKANGY